MEEAVCKARGISWSKAVVWRWSGAGMRMALPRNRSRYWNMRGGGGGAHGPVEQQPVGCPARRRWQGERGGSKMVCVCVCGGRRCRNLRALQLGALLAHEVHPEKRGVARVHARSAGQIAQHAAPRALAVDGAVALQPAAVSNERVAQEDGFSERGVAQRRQQAAGDGGIESIR